MFVIHGGRGRIFCCKRARGSHVILWFANLRRFSRIKTLFLLTKTICYWRRTTKALSYLANLFIFCNSQWTIPVVVHRKHSKTLCWGICTPKFGQKWHSMKTIIRILVRMANFIKSFFVLMYESVKWHEDLWLPNILSHTKL